MTSQGESMKKLILGIIILISAASASFAQSHEYSPLVEKTVNYKSWTLNDLANNKPTDLRSLMAGKKLVMANVIPLWMKYRPDQLPQLDIGKGNRWLRDALAAANFRRVMFGSADTGDTPSARSV